MSGQKVAQLKKLHINISMKEIKVVLKYLTTKNVEILVFCILRQVLSVDCSITQAQGPLITDGRNCNEMVFFQNIIW